MSKKDIVIMMLLVNILLGVLFVFSNYYIWNKVNADTYSSPNWNPIIISYVHRIYSHGELVHDGLIFIYNYPFWVYWVAMIVNILFGIMLFKSKS